MSNQGTSSHAADLLNQAGSKTRDRADGQVRTLAGSLSSVADDLGQMADRAGDPNGSLAGLARDGARFTRTMADRLDRDGLDGALDEMTSFARRRPMLFLAGAFAAGIGLGRLTRNADLGRMAETVKEAQPGGTSGNGHNGSGLVAGTGTARTVVGDSGYPADQPGVQELGGVGQSGASELGAMGLRPEAAGERYVPGTEDPTGGRGRL